MNEKGSHNLQPALLIVANSLFLPYYSIFQDLGTVTREPTALLRAVCSFNNYYYIPASSFF